MKRYDIVKAPGGSQILLIDPSGISLSYFGSPALHRGFHGHHHTEEYGALGCVGDCTLSEMKSVMIMRCLDVGRILRCDRVVRVGRARRVRLVRDVHKLLDVARQGAVVFDDVRFLVRYRIVTRFFRKDELVGCWDPHSRNIEGCGEGRCRRRMRPAQVTRERRRSSRGIT
jgi:hypothetical protein